VSPAELDALVAGSGWHVGEIFRDGAAAQYIAVLAADAG
jgi:hypothetical protein